MALSDDDEVRARQLRAMFWRLAHRGVSTRRSVGGGTQRMEVRENANSVGFRGEKPRVFISFHYEDDAGPIELLRHQAKNSDTLEFTDYSAKEPWESDEWKKRCEERIWLSTVLVVAIGEKTHIRPAVLWEINKAYALNKPVIGMRIYKNENHRIPTPLIEHGSPIVPWELDALQAELDQLRTKVPAVA